jgi:hypothetical protein
LAGLPILGWAARAANLGSLRGMIAWLGMLLFYFYGYALYTVGRSPDPLPISLSFGIFMVVSAVLWAFIFAGSGKRPEFVFTHLRSPQPA